jgi:enamine deaminase RidA (YjgF/YER057c/UK114 family)
MEFFSPQDWPRASGYSRAVSATGKQVHTAGQIGADPLTGKMVGGNLVDEARQTFRNLVAVLGAADARPDQIQSLNWYVTDKDDYISNAREIGAAFREIIGKHFPAITMVVVAALMLDDAHMEVSAIACIED